MINLRDIIDLKCFWFQHICTYSSVSFSILDCFQILPFKEYIHYATNLMNFLGCDDIFFLRFLPSGGRFEESKYRWRRQEKRGGGATDKSQAAISVIFENKQDAQKERGRERGRGIFLLILLCS